MKEQPEFMVCMPLDKDKNIGSTMPGNCSKCDAPIAISQSTLTIMSESGAESICLKCIIAMIKDDLEFDIMPPNRDQLKEIEAELERRKNGVSTQVKKRSSAIDG